MNKYCFNINSFFKNAVIYRKHYLIFTIFLNNKSIDFLLQKISSRFTTFKTYKIDEKKKIYASVEFDLKHYSLVKISILNFLKGEDFNFLFTGVCVNNNLMDLVFFEQNFFNSIDKYEQFEDFYVFLYLQLLNKNIFIYKLVFLFYFIFLSFQNYIKKNVYNTSGGF